MKYAAVIFDLDGTLVDSLADLADSMNAALAHLGFPAHPQEAYRYFVGDGMRQLARRVLPDGEKEGETLERTIRLMADEYEKRWDAKTRPYPGIPELLKELTNVGMKLAVLSNKPDVFTKKMVPSLLPEIEFDQVIGARPGVPVKPDPQAALEIAANWGIAPERILYLGDTSTDMLTANAAGMCAVGVAWGFRPEAELTGASARLILRHPLELLGVLA